MLRERLRLAIELRSGDVRGLRCWRTVWDEKLAGKGSLHDAGQIVTLVLREKKCVGPEC